MLPHPKEEELRVLFNQWLEGKCDEQAIRQLASYADDPDLADAWRVMLAAIPGESSNTSGRYHQEIDEVYQRLIATQPELQSQQRAFHFIRLIKYAAAILIILMAGGLGYFLFTNHHHTKESTAVAYNIVPVNTSKAILTLGNGTKIPLDQSGKEQLAKQTGPAVFLQSDSGYITYRNKDQAIAAVQLPEYNTVSTPKGGEYKIVLPDGTRVWLNTASSLTFPTAFTGSLREVSVTGEAYFEVTRNAAMPFRVKINNNAAVEVLGTSFNISAYPEEQVVKTTLLEGAVKLVNGKESRLLKPGQEGRFDNSNGGISITTVDVTAAVAWKNGTFDFRNQDITEVMNQISRWYNVEIVYENGKPEGTILGMISRSTDLVTVLKSLELTSGIHFITEGGNAPGQRGKIIVRQ
ncbi:FecR domain-containing protein [Chitinophaga sp.]|uniref:FecR domain-containing protein n=1 Tax=Chitinophaga sp. TaxID=1869181 RepID=UPI002F94A058